MQARDVFLVAICVVIAVVFFTKDPLADQAVNPVRSSISNGVNPWRAAGEILDRELPKLVPPNAPYGLRGIREENIFTLWGYWSRKGCARKHIIAQVDIETITESNYKFVAEAITMAGQKFLAAQKRKKSVSIAFENLPEAQKKIANDIWAIGNHIGEHTANAGMDLFIALSSHRSDPIVSWCLATKENRNVQERVAMFILPRLETLEEEETRRNVNRKIFNAYEKIQDVIRRTASKQGA